MANMLQNPMAGCEVIYFRAAILLFVLAIGNATHALALQPISGVMAISAGEFHSCALTTSGGVKCWGSNASGELGDGTTTDRLTPVNVSGLSSGVAGISGGSSVTCALTAGGGVKCWGSNFYGQLGDGTRTDRLTPATVTGLAGGVAAIAASDNSCALTTTGGVKCWGANYLGGIETTPVDVAGLTGGVAAISAGMRHTCALTTVGGVKCWGENLFGKLGDGTTTSRTTPMDVTGLTGDIAAISAGTNHTCALTTTGGVKCWGNNGSGQLGDGTTADRFTEVNVSDLTSGMTAIETGGHHACALTTTGGVKCWGSNAFGQIGDGTTTNRLVPVDVSGLTTGVMAISAGMRHTCALTTVGGVKCWGYNYNGQVGDGTATQRLTPTDVVYYVTPDAFYFPTQSNVPLNSVRVSGAVTPTGFQVPVSISVVGGAYSIECSGQFTADAGTIAPGQSVCVRHISSNLPSTTVTTTLTIGGVSGTFQSTTATPLSISTSSALPNGNLGLAYNASIVAIGGIPPYAFSLIGGSLPPGLTLLASGEVGGKPTDEGNFAFTAQVTDSVGATVNKAFSLVVLDTMPDAFSFAAVTGAGLNAIQVSNTITPAGYNTTAPISITGGEYSIGCAAAFLSSAGSISPGQTVCVRHISGAAAGTTTGTTLTIGGTSGSFVSTTAGTSPYTFTVGSSGTGSGRVISTPAGIDCGTNCIMGLPSPISVSLEAVPNVDSTFAGWSGACTGTGACTVLVDAQKAVSATFDASAYELSLSIASAPVRTTLAAGYQHSCALTMSGGVKCWGANDYGQLGDGTQMNRPTPVNVTGLTSGVEAIAAGFGHTCALIKGGGVKCWGNNGSGQLGDGTTTLRLTPVDVTGLASGVAAIESQDSHTCALTTAGGVKCWGNNGSGQLGDGTSTQRLTPVDVTGLASGVAAISAGNSHTCALTTSGGAKCWGNNLYGALGDGTMTNQLLPADVTGLTSGVAAIRAGVTHTCALTESGAVKCWGRNFAGQLGDGTTTDRLTPVDVAGLTSGITAVAAGSLHSCTLTLTGGVKCWGSNGTGRLGDGTTTDRHTPVDVIGLASGVEAIAAGFFHTCALTIEGGVKCWGDNSRGQLGDGTAIARPAPVDVVSLSASYGGDVVSSTPSGIFCGTTCKALFDIGTTVTLTPAPRLGFVFAGWSGACSGTVSTCQVTMDAARSVTATFEFAPVLSSTPASLGFGGQSMNTTAPAQAVTITNTGGSPLTVSAVTASTYFAVTHDCATVAAGASCTANVTFTPTAEGSLNGTLTVATNAGNVTVPLAGTGERSLVTHYYRAILRRAPDAGGKAFWESEKTRLQGLGANLNETWYAMATFFFFSPEYASFNRDGAGFVTDLYNTFFNRGPDAGGLEFWTGQLSQGMPREVVLVSFMFSNEFRTFTQAIFGNVAARKEVDTVVDFYRGLLSRLPDDGGFASWVGRFRVAQCSGSNAVNAEVEAISRLFVDLPEYANRARSNSQYVSDLYNTFLRRGGELAGVNFWISELDALRRSRYDVRQQFIASQEFQSRVAAIIAEGCVP